MDRIDPMESTNFEMLRQHWPDLASLGGHAEAYVFDDPQSALIKLRCFAEKLVGIVYREWALPCYPNDKFIDRLEKQCFRVRYRHGDHRQASRHQERGEQGRP